MAVSMYICESHAVKLSTVEPPNQKPNRTIKRFIYITENSIYGEKCILQFILWI